MPQTSTIKRLFIANRGEIAKRIGLTCRHLGIDTVAFKHSGKVPLFLQETIDEFIFEAEESTSTYLNHNKVISAALKGGCDAIHPGFGFLSENAEFARQVEEAGLIWIGPSPKTISSMASKAEARTIAESSQVPCVPGIKDLSDSPEDIKTIINFGEEFGYPLLIKAALGGGGKGMRVVEGENEVKEAVKRAASEALSSFGDSNLIVERYLRDARHIEIQILGDKHGRAIALGDRDCSVQRRHQKILEEAPAPYLKSTTRKALEKAALQLADQVKYESAGTVEFLLDWSDPNGPQNFYFLEMNTRLQVEHTVTEQIFGTDLVQWQIWIAEGRPLPTEGFKQVAGHSIEARIYAEDPEQGFLPSPGFAAGFITDSSRPLRWEKGLDEVDNISLSFDPMIAKAISTGGNRKDAILQLAKGLESTVLAGVTTNLEYLGVILSHEGFRADCPKTNYIDTYNDLLLEKLKAQRAERENLANILLSHQDTSPGANTSVSPEFITQSAFRKAQVKYEIETLNYSSFSYRNDNRISTTTGTNSFDDGSAWATYKWIRHQNNKNYINGIKIKESYFEQITPKDTIGSVGNIDHDQEGIKAPVPGKVVSIKYNKSDNIKKNQVVMILESMKMEFEVKATKAGIIEEVLVDVGDQVDADDPLITWKN